MTKKMKRKRHLDCNKDIWRLLIQRMNKIAMDRSQSPWASFSHVKLVACLSDCLLSLHGFAETLPCVIWQELRILVPAEASCWFYVGFFLNPLCWIDRLWIGFKMSCLLLYCGILSSLVVGLTLHLECHFPSFSNQLTRRTRWALVYDVYVGTHVPKVFQLPEAARRARQSSKRMRRRQLGDIATVAVHGWTVYVPNM